MKVFKALASLFKINLSMFKGEDKLWDELKKKLQNNDDPDYMVSQALATINNVLNRREGEGKKSKGLQKLHDNLVDSKTLSDQLNILASGKGTGWGTAWDSELREFFKKFQQDIKKYENIPAVKFTDANKMSESKKSNNDFDNKISNNETHQTNEIMKNAGHDLTQHEHNSDKVLNGSLNTEGINNLQVQNDNELDNPTGTENKESKTGSDDFSDALGRVLTKLTDPKFGENLKKIYNCFELVKKDKTKFDDLISLIVKVLDNFKEYKDNNVSTVLDNLKISIKNLQDNENPLFTNKKERNPESSYYLELNKLDKLCYHGVQKEDKNDFYHILRWTLKYILHPLPFELLSSKIDVKISKGNSIIFENKKPNAKDFKQLGGTMQCWFLSTLKNLVRKNPRSIKNIFRKYAPDFTFDSSKPMFLYLYKPNKIDFGFDAGDGQYPVTSLAKPTIVEINPWTENKYPLEKHANIKKGSKISTPSWPWLIEKGLGKLATKCGMNTTYLFNNRGQRVDFALLFLVGDSIRTKVISVPIGKEDDEKEKKRCLQEVKDAIMNGQGVIGGIGDHWVSVMEVDPTNLIVTIQDQFNKESKTEKMYFPNYPMDFVAFEI